MVASAFRRKGPFGQRRVGGAGRTRFRDRPVCRHRAELRDRRQFLRDRAPERRARPAGHRPHASPHHRRYRPVGGIDDGTLGRSVRGGLSRLESSDRRRCGDEPADRLRRRGTERHPRGASRHPAAHRHARHVLAVPRHRRRHHARRRQLHGISRLVSCHRAGVSVGLRSDATRDLRRGIRRLRDASAPFDHRPGAVRDRILSGRGPVCGHSGRPPPGPRVLSVRTERKRRRDRLRRASWTGTIGRRQRLRARRNHSRGAWRHVGVRRTRHFVRDRARPVCVVGAAQRPAPGGAAVGTCRRADRHPAARDHRDRSCPHSRPPSRARILHHRGHRREEQPGCRPLCHRSCRLADRRRHATSGWSDRLRPRQRQHGASLPKIRPRPGVSWR